MSRSEAGPGQARATQTRGALVITDIVDSTRTNARLGDQAMAAVWVRHDEAVRALLDRWRGREIDRTDGFLLLFERAGDALGFCRDLHQTLDRLSAALAVPLKARAAIHCGSVILLENSPEDRARGAKPVEIEGLAKPLTARVASITPGGHTLVTGVAADMLAEEPLLHRGWWMFKGAAEPLEIYEVVEPGRTAVTLVDTEKAWAVRPAGGEWQPVRDVRHNLPAERDAFVGRAEELASIADHFEAGGRLVTLVGPGGMGKSRLSRRFGWSSLGSWAGGVRFAALADARDVDGIVRLVGTALDVPIKGGDPVLRLGQAMQGRGRFLLILDNVEQVLASASETVDRWLDLAPELCVLVTSRSPLNVAGERIVSLAPLSPEVAAALFTRRAADARANNPLSPAERDEVTRLAALLDGLPLAIELAAARTRLLTVGQIRDRLSDRFQLLRGGRPENPRHSTLRAALDWSWDLLSPPERAALAQLSVFEGSFDLAAAEEVVNLSAWPDAPEVLELAQVLLDRSLLQTAEPVHGVARLQTMLSVRAYAAERLSRLDDPYAPADLRAETERRQIAHYARFGVRDRPRARVGLSELAWRNTISANLSNMEVALQRARTLAPERAPALLLALWQGYFDTGPYRRWLALAEDAVANLPMTEADRCVLNLKMCQMVAYCRPPADLHALTAETIALAERVGDLRSLSGALNTLAPALALEGRVDEALTLVDRSLRLAEEEGDPVSRAHAYIVRGMVNHVGGRDVRGAIAPYMEALRIAREEEASSTEAIVLLNLGASLLDLGELDRAVEHLKAALNLSRTMHARLTENLALSNLGAALACLGRLPEARDHLEQAMRSAAELGSRRDMAVILLNFAMVDQREGRYDEALGHLRQAVIEGRAAGLSRFTTTGWLGQARIHLLRDQLAEAERAHEQALAEADDPLAALQASLLVLTAWLRARQGRLDEARASLAAFEAMRAATPDLGYEEMELDLRELRAALGEDPR